MLATIIEEDGVLTLKQSRDEAWRDLQTALFASFAIVPLMLVWSGLSLAQTSSLPSQRTRNPRIKMLASPSEYSFSLACPLCIC